MKVYRMKPAHSELDWFERNKCKQLITYDTGEKLAEFDEGGRGRWYYRNGRLALDYYTAEEKNTEQRIVIYSSGEPDERGRARPYTILATFDYLGNGIVFDHTGKIRLKYNQTEGVVLDRSIGPVSHWKWHSLNDPPVLHHVMVDNKMVYKDPTILKLGVDEEEVKRLVDEDILTIEAVKNAQQNKKFTRQFKPFQIKLKTLKINENFSLRVVDQASIYLIYRDGTAHLKLNIGMILDPKSIIGTEEEVGEVTTHLERTPPQTESLIELQKKVTQAQDLERFRNEHENLLRCPQTTKLTTTDPITSSLSTKNSVNNINFSRKPKKNNIYYSTRL